MIIWPLTYTGEEFFSWLFVIWVEMNWWVQITIFWLGPIFRVISFAVESPRAVVVRNIVWLVLESGMGGLTIWLMTEHLPNLRVWFKMYNAINPWENIALQQKEMRDIDIAKGIPVEKDLEF